jgi:hypothetical protein
VDHFTRSGVCKKKRRRDRLIRLSEGRPQWVVGFLDETWWSRLARPALKSWSEAGEPLRLIEQSVEKDDPDPKAISCYGLYVPEFEKVWLRFVDGRPVSGITTRFLSWCCERLEAAGKRVWVLIWDNASWHISKEVREWLGSHNREVKDSGCGVRIISCLLPKRARGSTLWSPSGSMVSARWSSLTDCSQLTSWLSEYARSLTVRITSTCPLPKMLPDRALGALVDSNHRVRLS